MYLMNSPSSSSHASTNEYKKKIMMDVIKIIGFIAALKLLSKVINKITEEN
jgi:hypothetical protein